MSNYNIAPHLAPGSWLEQSQQSVARLSRCATIDDVVEAFGTARILTTLTLGYPTSGGHATKPMIRLVGELLHHRLGPAVAAEALGLASLAWDLLDTAGVELLLRKALSAKAAFRPLEPSRRTDLVQWLGPLTSDERTFAIVGPEGLWSENRNSRRDFSDRHYGRVEYGRDCDLLEKPALRLLGASPVLGASPESVAEPRLENDDALHELAVDPGLFDADEATIAQVFAYCPACVLVRNPSVPAGLLRRIRYPYDDATLALAMRAYRHSFGRTRRRLVDKDRLRVMLAAADADRLSWLAEQGPGELAHSLGYLGLLTASIACEVVPEVNLIRVVEGGTFWNDTALLTEIAIRHPNRALANAIVTYLFKPTEPMVRRLLEVSDLRNTAAKALTPEWLRPDDAGIVLKFRPDLVPYLPGLPADRRPKRALSPIAYPSPDTFLHRLEIEALDGRQLGHGLPLRIRLPKNLDALRSNARVMCNCTVSAYGNQSDARDDALLVVEGSDGPLFNAHVQHRGDQWRVSEVLGRHNSSDGAAAVRRQLESVMRELSRPLTTESDSIEPVVRTRKLRRRPGGGIRPQRRAAA